MKKKKKKNLSEQLNKTSRKIVEIGKIDTRNSHTNVYLTVHFPVLVQALQ